ncbi:vacuolar cation/proton exchanger 5-like isoform X2 [Gastrolobium bilobum]|uniref:vacuolar cation/proton exchanger 5-like isoform X2 n=1 Tax=Gastrolobium bilobum TaxID=150636 RepID=UPI002AAF705B|nr:vacuolar cation/proton exchanger 5-like isoform X2 [Gastrolobium bilobum]
METRVEVEPTLIASRFLDDLSKTCKMGSPNGRSMNKSEDEVPFGPELNFQQSDSTLVDVHGSRSEELQTAHRQTLRGIIYRSIRVVVFSNKLNLLMFFGPLAILLQKLTGHHGWVFALSLLGIMPLAERLGYATEQLAFYTGDTVGGLLNATFGNATELIISIYALKSGMTRVVQLSLLGSILSNMLLVLGCAFLSGGIVFHKKEQVFNKSMATVNLGLLLMAVMGLLFPAVLHYTHTEVDLGKSELALSRFSSCIMLVAYAAYLFFQLKSQKNLYVSVNEEGQDGNNANDDDSPDISKWESIIWLSVMTAWISILSEYLVNAIEGASTAWKIPVSFISVILLPLVGNAAEHASAIMFAMKDKLDISLGVAIGSSTQISMFVVPFCVVIGWITGHPMDLNFQLFETAALFLTVIVVAFMLQEGTANYFKGLMLVLCYLIVAASFYVHVDSYQ